MRFINPAIALVLFFCALVLTRSQTPQSTNQKAQTTSRAPQTQMVTAKKVLVKKLPKGLEGVVLEKGVFKLKPGYGFVDPTANTVVVALKNNGGAAGTFSCSCSYISGTPKPSGSCKIVVDTQNATVSCKNDNDPCTGTCFLDVKVNRINSRLAIY